MNRLTRITSILIRLQTKKITTSLELAEYFNVSVRTIYRDIRTLEEAGVPISSENGVGYSLVEGYHLPPISLTEQEANSLIISEQFIKNQGDSSVQRDFESMLAKIKSVLKSVQKDNIELLENRISTNTKGDIPKSVWLSSIQTAMINGHVINLSYQSGYKDEYTDRSIEPLAVYFSNNAWIVVANCRLRNDVREFRLDRILAVNATNETFNVQSDFSLFDYFASLIH
jgi:predicted DNA-binding transcriptional regulator YafY